MVLCMTRKAASGAPPARWRSRRIVSRGMTLRFNQQTATASFTLTVIQDLENTLFAPLLQGRNGKATVLHELIRWQSHVALDRLRNGCRPDRARGPSSAIHFRSGGDVSTGYAGSLRLARGPGRRRRRTDVKAPCNAGLGSRTDQIGCTAPSPHATDGPTSRMKAPGPCCKIQRRSPPSQW
jgi:hypothetical protein